jgi:hypothetical protein
MLHQSQVTDSNPTPSLLTSALTQSPIVVTVQEEIVEPSTVATAQGTYTHLSPTVDLSIVRIEPPAYQETPESSRSAQLQTSRSVRRRSSRPKLSADEYDAKFEELRKDDEESSPNSREIAQLVVSLAQSRS